MPALISLWNLRLSRPYRIATLELLSDARIICIYRQAKLIIPDGDTKLAADDDVVVIAHRDLLPKLEERWGPELAENKSEQLHL